MEAHHVERHVGYPARVELPVTWSRLARVGFVDARRLLVSAGIVILAVLAGSLWLRGADTVEVAATMLYLPILLGLLFFGVAGGVVTALSATGVYVGLRADAIDVVGAGEFTGLILSRGLAYLLFGAVGGWASAVLEQSVDKLALHDEIDDQTGTGNARSLRRHVDLEDARASRYRSVYSVSFVQFAAEALDPLSGRRRRALLRALGQRLQDAIRAVDHVAHDFDGRTHRVAAVLPETAGGGAAIFHDRFVAAVGEVLAAHGVDGEVGLSGRWCTLPGDEQTLATMLGQWSGAADANTPAAR